jgi:tripeptide aminopeptidase
MDVLQKFLRYVRVDTPSDEENDINTPSTACQMNLANMLCEELKALGLSAEVTKNGYVYSAIEANCDSTAKIGFISHIDVVSEPCGRGVEPQVIKGYLGGDIVKANGNKILVDEFPVLKNYIGDDIVISSGDTILGADDKAGIAEIMELCEYLTTHPEVKHGKIGIAFTPDEEIGHGARLFDVKKFDCDFAYTVDGEEIGEICYETFNGAAFDITIEGVNIHPGQAKGKMINAIVIANEFISALPKTQRPETTEGREGYYFVNQISGGVEKCKVSGIIRDHDRKLFEERKAFVVGAVEKLNKKYAGRLHLSMRDQYYNCAEVITPHMHLVENVKNAMEQEGVTPIVSPIRGGTDGSCLSFMGLPCPNICTGGHNAHSTSEFIPVGSMQKVVNILQRIVAAYVK